jgi:hypothetical protein
MLFLFSLKTSLIDDVFKELQLFFRDKKKNAFERFWSQNKKHAFILSQIDIKPIYHKKKNAKRNRFILF